MDFWENFWGGVSLLIAGLFILCSFVYSVLLNIVTEDDPASFILLATMVFSEFALLMWSYGATHFTRPPDIPAKYHFTSEEWSFLEEHGFQTEAVRERLSAMAVQRGVRTRSYSGHVNYCYQCRLIKPERTHHCSMCRRCIARMDHHCPYFGNCIHFSNFKFFVLTLFHASLACLLIVLSTVVYVVVHGRGLHRMYDNIPAMVVFGFMMGVCIIIVFTIGGFFCVSMKQAIHNMTTLESIGGTVLFADGTKETYDLGSYMMNLRQLFGPVMIAWFVPIYSTPGDGMTFLVRSELPKEDKQRKQERKLKPTNFLESRGAVGPS